MKENEKPMRIGHVIGKWVGGGVEAVVMNYYRNINRDKIQFDFICDEDSTNIPYNEIEKLGGRVILVPPYQRTFKYIKKLIRIFIENKYKIVHSHINTLSIFPLFAAKKAGVPIRIAHSHSTTNKKEWEKDIIKRVLRPFSKVFATDYFACSELAGRWLFGDKAFDQGKVYIVNNAIDVDKFKFNQQIRDKKRKELGIEEDTLIIGHIGRFVEQKNHTFLIDVFNEVVKEKENSKLMLVGQGPLKERIEEKVKKLGLTDKVLFLGQRDDTNELYQAMDVFVLPSLYEGLPVVGIEAQAAGLPCIFSNLMTKESKILDSTKFLSLKDKEINWSKASIDSDDRFTRKDISNLIINNAFCIKNESVKLEKIYG